MRHVRARFVEFDDLALRQNLFAEIALVHRALQDDLVNALQFRECEFLRQQFVSDCRPFDLVSQPQDRVIENPRVIESQLRRIEDDRVKKEQDDASDTAG